MLVPESREPLGRVLRNSSEQGWAEYFAFAYPALEEKLSSVGIVSTHEEFAEGFSELKKYFILLLALGRIPMPSSYLDDIWHQFILFTRAYHEFCDRFFGQYVHHMPATSLTPLDDEAPDFEASYRRYFGDPPAVWRRTTAAPVQQRENGVDADGMKSIVIKINIPRSTIPSPLP